MHGGCVEPYKRLPVSFLKKAPLRPPRVSAVTLGSRGPLPTPEPNLRVRVPGTQRTVLFLKEPVLRDHRGRKRPSPPAQPQRDHTVLHHLSPGSRTAAPRLHSRVVITHGQQQAAEEPHVGVQPRGRHVPHMIYHTHPARRHRGSAAADRTPRSGTESQGKFQNGGGAGVLPAQARLRPPGYIGSYGCACVKRSGEGFSPSSSRINLIED